MRNVRPFSRNICTPWAISNYFSVLSHWLYTASCDDANRIVTCIRSCRRILMYGRHTKPFFGKNHRQHYIILKQVLYFFSSIHHHLHLITPLLKVQPSSSQANNQSSKFHMTYYKLLRYFLALLFFSAVITTKLQQ